MAAAAVEALRDKTCLRVTRYGRWWDVRQRQRAGRGSRHSDGTHSRNERNRVSRGQKREDTGTHPQLHARTGMIETPPPDASAQWFRVHER